MPSLAEIAESINGRLDGDGATSITHCCEIDPGSPEGLTVLGMASAVELLEASPASAVILSPGAASAGRPAIRVDNPAKGFAQALALLHPAAEPVRQVHPATALGGGVSLGKNLSIGPFAVIGDGAVLEDDVIIGAGVVIGDGVVVGPGSRLFPRVVLYDRVQIGADVRIHSGTVIGSDGFGFVTENDTHIKVPQVGRVVIGDRVEIGANCTIDRGTIGETVIGEDTKLDNLVHIAHNVKIGRGCLFAAEVGIAGSTVIGDYVTLAGQVGVISHISIGDRTVVASRAAVLKPIGAGQFCGGFPAEDQRQWLRKQVALKSLPEMLHRLHVLEQQRDSAGTAADASGSS